ncbi:hypothetical protein HO133_010245 [Letharia lupina]|nr:uncharacterized protein HO133_010245 [Letharia lupina]KAF6225050.1 hypothetical protein HO133_010245 [Letharia lupina]
MNVSSYRRAAKVPYPNAYASAAECKESKEKYLFNCAQRSHGNYLEHQPQMLVGLLIGGLKYPVVSAAIGTAWCASRVAYTIGYCRKDKSDGSGRQIGVASSFLEMALMVMSGMTGYQMITG